MKNNKHQIYENIAIRKRFQKIANISESYYSDNIDSIEEKLYEDLEEILLEKLQQQLVDIVHDYVQYDEQVKFLFDGNDPDDSSNLYKAADHIVKKIIKSAKIEIE